MQWRKGASIVPAGVCHKRSDENAVTTALIGTKSVQWPSSEIEYICTDVLSPWCTADRWCHWCRRRELNPRPTHYECVALPLSYCGLPGVKYDGTTHSGRGRRTQGSVY